MRILAAIAAGAVVFLGTRVAEAEPVEKPIAPRTLYTPTAYLQGASRVFASAGGDHRGGGFFALSLGLGELAEVDLEIGNRLAACEACADGDPVATSLTAATALFKIGLGEARFGRWQPALALGLRAPLGRVDAKVDGADLEVRAARLYLAASKSLGQVTLHGGVDVWDAGAEGAGGVFLLHDAPLSERVRPFAALAWNPAVYPRTTLLAELSFAPVVESRDIALRWLGGWGVRYQALSWGSIELAMRHRGGDSLGDSTVVIRLNGVLQLPRW